MNIGLIIMAAGTAKRFGGKKLLTKFNNKPLYKITIDCYSRLNISPKIIVTNETEIIEYAKERGYICIRNPYTLSGVSSTIQLGIENIPNNIDGVIFAVCDQPYINVETIKKMMDIFNEAGSRDKIVVPFYKDIPGNPTIIGSDYLKELSKLTGDHGGKVVLNRHKEEFIRINIRDEKEFFDVDYRKDVTN